MNIRITNAVSGLYWARACVAGSGRTVDGGMVGLRLRPGT
jgi:hypothetical protein